MDWKSIIHGVTITVVAGAVLAFFAWLFTPIFYNPQIIRAELKSTRVYNPIYAWQIKKVRELEDKMALPKMLRPIYKFIEYKKDFRLGSIIIENTSEKRSKSIEVYLENGVLYDDEDISFGQLLEGNAKAKIKIDHIDPNEKVFINYISTEYSNFDSSILIIHDDEKVYPYVEEITKYIPFYHIYRKIVVEYSVIVSLMMFVIFIFLILYLILLLYYMSVKDKLKFRAQLTSSKALDEQIEFIEYVKENFPEKYPKIKSQ